MKDDVCSLSILRRIIAIHKNKARLKRLNNKKEGQVEVTDVEVSEEEERDEDEVPLKHKRQVEEEASRSKRVKTSKAKDSKKTLPHASTISPKKKKLTNTFSPTKSKSKSFKATTSRSSPKIQNQSPHNLKPNHQALPRNPNSPFLIKVKTQSMYCHCFIWRNQNLNAVSRGNSSNSCRNLVRPTPSHQALKSPTKKYLRTPFLIQQRSLTTCLMSLRKWHWARGVIKKTSLGWGDWWPTLKGKGNNP